MWLKIILAQIMLKPYLIVLVCSGSLATGRTLPVWMGTDCDITLIAQNWRFLVATAWQQLNDQNKTRKYITLARDWGCDKKLIARLLVAGVHNTLGRAAAANHQKNRALNYFRSA